MRYLLPLLFLTLTACQSDTTTRATIYTNRGEIDILLYDDTPRHTKNFVRLAEEGFYTGTLFHRVVPGFMIQGGDPLSKDATPMADLGMGGPGYELDPEIGAPHIRGAIAAARSNNPEKRSNGSQFYIVTGQLMADNDLNQIERIKSIKYSEAQREAYRPLGGRPDLDQDYTVFGEVTAGMDVVEEIAEVDVNGRARPLEDVVIERIEIK
jgi:peptidyl-prolyl cis-trans isomerase B (cyclophilin B)